MTHSMVPSMAGTGEGLTIPLSDGSALEAELFVPPVPGPHPGVLVLHESFGLNDDMRRIAARFAATASAAFDPVNPQR